MQKTKRVTKIYKIRELKPKLQQKRKKKKSSSAYYSRRKERNGFKISKSGQRG